MSYTTIIGFELQCEIKTNTKMFSGSKVSFNGDTNTNVNEIDMGMPGTLPSINKRAIEQAIKACHIFDMDINPILRFDRKCYFYPDLTKGFQITQEDYPIGTNGYIDIEINDSKKRVNIDKLIIEEDTAELINQKDYTLINYNRSGNPLIRIVCSAATYNAKEIISYIDTLRNMLLLANISGTKMEEGLLRCNLDISVQDTAEKEISSITRIKNLDSILDIEKAIDYEIERQMNILNNNQTLSFESRKFDKAMQKTIVMDCKNEIIDYRFHREPNILKTIIDQSLIEKVKDEISLI